MAPFEPRFARRFFGLEAMSFEAVALEAVPLEAMSLQAVSLEAMSASCVLHEFSLLDVSPVADFLRRRVSDLVKKDVMQPQHTKSREKGSSKLTCPKADMPKSR
jgi:hypothetical protein